MARKNANSSPGVWLGLLLVLVAHTLAQSTHLKEVPEWKDSQKNYDYDIDSAGLGNLGDPPKGLDSQDSISDNGYKPTKDDAKDFGISKRKNEVAAKTVEINDRSVASSEEISKKANANVDEITTAVKIQREDSTPGENDTISTTETIDFDTHLSMKEDANNTSLGLRVNSTGVTTIEGSQSQTGSNIVENRPTIRYQEFESTEEDNIEEHASSDRAEATTPSTNSFGPDSKNIGEEQSGNHNSGNRDPISLVNDTNVNYSKYPRNQTKHYVENDTSISMTNNGVNSSSEPKHQVEILKNVTEIEVAIVSTTPYYSSSSRPKGRTISIADDNDLSTKKPINFNHSDVDESTPVTIVKVSPKKKSTESKPYPYIKLETKIIDQEVVTENSNKTETTTEKVSAYENTIDTKKPDEKIVVTEPSVLVENSIQQFKPIHNKRSGNSSRVNSSGETPLASTAWSLATTEDLTSKIATEIAAEFQTTFPDFGNRSQINNDIHRDNPKESVTTERSPAILSEVTENNIETVIGKINGTYNLTASTPISKKLTERSEVTAVENIPQDTSKFTDTKVQSSTEKMETVSNGSSTSNEIQTGKEESNITLNQFNVTKASTEYPLSIKNVSTAIEISVVNASNTTEKSGSEMETTVSLPETIFTTTEFIEQDSSEMPTSQTTEAKSTEENVTNVTEIHITPESGKKISGITESTTSQTTNVEYEFVELSTPGVRSTVLQGEVASTEKINTTTDILNTASETTESEETMITEVSIEQNETTSSREVETVNPETPTSSNTLISDTTTAYSISNSEIATKDDLSNATNNPVSESNFPAVTDVLTDTTLSSTSFNDKASNGPVDVTTTGQSDDPEEVPTTIETETVPPTEETTAVSNIEVIVPSESSSTTQTSTTVTKSTTLQIQSTSELPEFRTTSDDVTLFVRIVIEGSWTDVCPVLSDLKLSLANLLTEGTGRTVLPRNIILHQTQCSMEATSSTTLSSVVLYVVDDNGNFDLAMTEILPSLYKKSEFVFPLAVHSVEKLVQTEPSNNAIAVVAVSSVAFICLVLLAGLLFIMRKRQTRFNYGERCRPVSLDAFRVDSVSAYNSVRRKGLTRVSKRSYGNPAFEDSSVTPTHPLNFAGLSSFCNDLNAITEEFEGIPQVTARMDELPAGSEVKNRYANVAPLPETRVLLQKINNEPLTEYINASYVRGPKNATKYYIACQAPMESTVSDFWRMIWEQQTKVIIMLTDIVENGVEKCVEYIPPSEVTDCHRLYGDYQVTLKKREAKEKFAISTLHLKNLETNTYREVSHIWYLWPPNGVPSNGTGLIAILLEARALQRGAPGPIVVHCSPGTGRTGTLIALDLGIRQYEITRTVDVPRVVYTIRRDRAGAVQTKEQYAFIYKALNLYAAKLAGGALESM